MESIYYTRVRITFDRAIPSGHGASRASRVSQLVQNATGEAVGVMLKWFSGPWACSPLQYFTNDDGHSFRRMTSFWLPDCTVDKRIRDVETNPETIGALRALLAAWRDGFILVKLDDTTHESV